MIQKVYKLNELSSSSHFSGITLGGGSYISNDWPKNPLGEDLALILSIDTDILSSMVNFLNLPSGKMISVYSTYNPDRYFLDQIVFAGGDVEFNYLKSGFTRVIVSNKDEIKSVKQRPHVKTELKETIVKDGAFPMYSLISKEIPNGMYGASYLEKDYYFICQVYSSDLPYGEGELLALSDANGYLFLKKEIVDDNDAGFFFVQTG